VDINIHFPDFDKFRNGIKAHIQEHKVAYSVGTTLVIAGISYALMRRIVTQHISRGIPVAAGRGIPVTVDKSVVINNASPFFGTNKTLNHVSYISSRRQGAPSWVIRCLETGDIYPSQLDAAKGMNLPASEISRHLNGSLDHVRGFNFERICMAA